MRHLHHCWVATLGLLVLSVSIGCTRSSGPMITPVSGQVLMEGQPLPDAMVVFEPSGGRSSLGKTDSQGNFVLQYSSTTKGALVGEHTVRISTFDPPHPAGPNGEMSTLKPEVVPKKYNKETELTRTVEDKWRGNQFTFELDPT